MKTQQLQVDLGTSRLYLLKFSKAGWAVTCINFRRLLISIVLRRFRKFSMVFPNTAWFINLTKIFFKIFRWHGSFGSVKINIGLQSWFLVELKDAVDLIIITKKENYWLYSWLSITRLLNRFNSKSHYKTFITSNIFSMSLKPMLLNSFHYTVLSLSQASFLSS